MKKLLAGHSNTCATVSAIGCKTRRADHKKTVKKESVRENSTKEAGAAKRVSPTN